MRSSAPRNRVVLAAIDRPRLGGEEPRDPHESEAIFAHAFTKLQWRIPSTGDMVERRLHNKG